jgi:hypothetical protein
MALERDNPAERLARINKLMADMTPTPPQQQIARLQASLMVVSLPQGPSLDTRDLSEAETRTRSATRFRLFLEPPSPCPRCKCLRVIRVGLVDDVGFFRCADCDGMFTIPHTARKQVRIPF